MEPNKGYRIMISNHSKQSDHVEYLITLVSMSDSSFKVEFYERYSVLKTLHDALRKETTSSSFPKFPPKKFFGSSDEKFLNQRQIELNTYFSSIFNNKDFCQLPSLKRWIEDALQKHSTSSNINQPDVKETQTAYGDTKKNTESSVEQNTAITKENLESEKKRIKEIINACSKQFIEMDRTNENDPQEDTDKVKEYNDICINNNVFANLDGNAIFADVKRDDNFNEDEANNTAFDEDLNKKAEDILNNFNKDFFEKMETAYNTSDLIINVIVDRGVVKAE